ncbi:MAG TPA: hypothetical protein DEF34_03160 [Desulfotomaculum sp.]|nr:hypothetical protein [Desulfotomaculum sp.]
MGSVLKEARTEYGLTQKVLGDRFHISGSMINEIEHDRRRLPKEIKPKMARELDDAALYLELAREATGGIGAPWLDRIDDHRVVCCLKFHEEVIEALEMLERVMPVLLRRGGREQVTVGELDTIKMTLVEIIEVVTAAQNTVARLAKSYGFSLAQLWDEHQEKLIRSGYLEQKK